MQVRMRVQNVSGCKQPPSLTNGRHIQWRHDYILQGETNSWSGFQQCDYLLKTSRNLYKMYDRWSGPFSSNASWRSPSIFQRRSFGVPMLLPSWLGTLTLRPDCVCCGAQRRLPVSCRRLDSRPGFTMSYVIGGLLRVLLCVLSGVVLPASCLMSFLLSSALVTVFCVDVGTFGFSTPVAGLLEPCRMSFHVFCWVDVVLRVSVATIVVATLGAVVPASRCVASPSSSPQIWFLVWASRRSASRLPA
jgi:hypothetical protein